MGATDNAGSDVAAVEHAQRDAAEDGLWTSLGMALRLIVGWLCVVVGLVNLIVEFDRAGSTPDGLYLIFHVVLLVGGLLLLALGWLQPDPGTVGYVAGGTVAVAGVVIGAIPATSGVCCLSAFAVRHGFPFTFLARPDGLGAAHRWHFDGPRMLADLLFWSIGGLLTLVAIALFRRAVKPDDGPGQPDREYIEHPGRPREQAHHKTVGPVP